MQHTNDSLKNRAPILIASEKMGLISNANSFHLAQSDANQRLQISGFACVKNQRPCVRARDLHANLAASASNGMTKLANTISARTQKERFCWHSCMKTLSLI
jgi:hypothetical protein